MFVSRVKGYKPNFLQMIHVEKRMMMLRFSYDRYDLHADKKVFDDIKRITHTIGAFYQAQNDFYDCFADQLNKLGHDIENRKLSWLATMAMELGSEEQKEVMRKNYGKYGKIELKRMKFKSIPLFKF